LPAVLAVAFGVEAYGCAAAPPPRVAIAPSPPPRPERPPQLPAAWTYWEPVDATVTLGPPAPPLPLAEAQVAIEQGAVARWAALSPEARRAVLEEGVAVTEAVPGARFAEAYASLAAARVPYVITMDALFWLAHVARDRALAAAEDAVLAPALETLLRRLELRLGEDVKTAPGDLLAGYALARGVVAVARALLSPAYHAPTDLARVVDAETKRIAAHAGPDVSPLLGVTLDYSQVVPRGAADASSARTAYALATAWLGAAPFAVAARGEIEGAELPFGRARASTRAALLLARLVDFDVDAESAYAMRRWITASEFAAGTSDDVSPRELLDVATSLGMDARDPRSFVDVVKVDRLRHALTGGRPPKLDDGGAIRGVPTHRGVPEPRVDFERAATSVRFFPARAAGDADVLQALVFPAVGKLGDAPGGQVPESSRDGVRAMPRALDVAAWLGAKDARALLHGAGDDAYERYDATLDALIEHRPAEVTQHDSVYASSLDAIATYLAPSAADAAQPGATSPAWRAKKLEAALAAWATLRHDALPFARFPLATAPAPAAPPAAPAPVATAAAPLDLPAFVEPHVEAIAQLLALVRQSTRGLRAAGEVPDTSPAIPILDEGERLLADALAIARREAQDEPLSPAEHEAMATFPARLTALEAKLAPSHAADVSLAVDVHTDLPSARALVEACGDLDDVTLVMREPGTGRLVVAAGVAATHYELTEPAGARMTDATWRARLHGSPPPAQDAFVKVLPLAPVATERADGGAEDGAPAP
jgi:hypothetical protein